VAGRYDFVPIAETPIPDGEGGSRTVRYLRRRPVPTDPTLPPSAWHRVVEGDRLDNIAARYLGEPLAFWMIADANRAMRTDDLVATIGEIVVIPTPEP